MKNRHFVEKTFCKALKLEHYIVINKTARARLRMKAEYSYLLIIGIIIHKKEKIEKLLMIPRHIKRQLDITSHKRDFFRLRDGILSNSLFNFCLNLITNICFDLC